MVINGVLSMFLPKVVFLLQLASKSVFSPHTPHSCVTLFSDDSQQHDDEELNGREEENDSAIETVNGSFKE